MTRLAMMVLALAPLLAEDRLNVPAPAFVAKSIKGEKFSKDSVKGRPVLLQFWATWCGYCRKDEPSVEKLTKEFASKGLLVLAVNVNEPKEKVQEYLAAHVRTPKIVLTEDTNLVRTFGPSSFPAYALIDKDGVIAGIQEGSGGETALRDLLSKAGLK